MNIQWFGHACFRVEAQGYAIVLDPYADGSVDGLPPLRLEANAVLCSHDHRDHSGTDAVTLTDANAPSPFTIRTIASVHDDENGAKRGPNTIHVLEANGLRVAHLGDLGVMLTPEQISAIGSLDALMIPVGGFYTIDAQTASAVCRALAPRVVLPMHYRKGPYGYAVLAELDDFLALRDNTRFTEGNLLSLDAETPAQTLVLTYP